MSENKFLAKMRGEKAPKSLVEVKNDKFLTPFVGLPKSTDVSHGFQNDAESSVIVANAAKNWGLQKTGLGLLEDASNAVYTGGVNVAGQNAWINLSYTFPTSSDSTNSVVSVINPSSKWVLRLVGKDLFSQNETIGFELVVKIGSTNIANIECATTRQAGFFCKTFVVDFSDSADKLIKVNGGDKLTVQLFCKDKTATACYYTGNSVLSLLERRIDADVVANEKTSFEDIVDGLKTKQDIATAINYDNITNCITEIPQDIKLELTGGTLTLKAGSKIYNPDGTPADVTVDRTYTGTVVGTYKGFVFCGSGGVITAIKDVNKVTSGTTEPTNPTGLDIFFNTNTKTFRIYSGTQWADWNVKYPVAVVSVENGVIASIDQVFNGFGYMGSTAFILPGVKGLIPNGRNADGTLNNKNFTVPSLFLSTITTGSYSGIFVLATTGMSIASSASEFEYDSERNVIYNKSSGTVYSDRIIAGFRSVSNGKIESLTPKAAFHAVDYNDAEYIAHQSMPSNRYVNLTLPASGGTITAPADGYVVLSKIATAAGQYIAISNGSVGKIRIYSSGNQQELQATLPVAKGHVVLLVYTVDGATQNFRFVYANGAK